MLVSHRHTQGTVTHSTLCLQKSIPPWTTSDNFSSSCPITVIFGTNITDRICDQKVIGGITKLAIKKCVLENKQVNLALFLHNSFLLLWEAHKVFKMLHIFMHACCQSLSLQRTSTDVNDFWQRCCWDSKILNGHLISHLSWLMYLHYMGTWTLEIGSFQSFCMCPKNDIALVCYIFEIYQPILMFCKQYICTIIVGTVYKLSTSTVCKYYFSPIHFV